MLKASATNLSAPAGQGRIEGYVQNLFQFYRFQQDAQARIAQAQGEIWNEATGGDIARDVVELLTPFLGEAEVRSLSTSAADRDWETIELE